MKRGRTRGKRQEKGRGVEVFECLEYNPVLPQTVICREVYIIAA